MHNEKFNLCLDTVPPWLLNKMTFNLLKWLPLLLMLKFIQVQLLHFFQHDDRLSQPALDFAAFFETIFPIGKLFCFVESNVICATTNILVSRTANC